jgi:hypothetical protein
MKALSAAPLTVLLVAVVLAQVMVAGALFAVRGRP